MDHMNIKYYLENHPVCDPKAEVKGKHYRITVLTPSLLRLEYSPDGVFEDRATQMVLNRDFPVPEFTVSWKGSILRLSTENLHLQYDTSRPFSKSSLFIKVQGNLSMYHSIWRFGDEPDDLKGTTRTLDFVDGATELEHGLMSRLGFSVIDDSRSMILTQDGWVEPRGPNACDIYFFGYGLDYQRCLRDFYHLCGKTPLLPRWALGNWWSRYHRYDEKEYKELILRFEREKIPFSVAVIDMDWHLVDIDPSYGSGWTGYTWNTELFPDPPAFLEWLHEHGLKVTLNVHPAEGVRVYEKAYAGIAAEMGADIRNGEPVEFDAADRKFIEAYLKCVHHPLEDEGVDFWWVDWQQGDTSRTPGIDPLWILNHFHYLDNKRRGRRPLILSRYAGIGSHRYPVGFSGDTIASWKSFRFQPYFTATASNVGYGWWSHDIGGHMKGAKDDELATRWIQFGVFSPVMRLHSSSNPFNSKEPWRFNDIAEKIMKKYLQLRHRLIPYLYTMNRLASRDGQPLIRPMYYLDPGCDEAYMVPNEYYFGTELIAAPITEPADKKLLAAGTRVWLPDGLWFDFFNGLAYRGGRMFTMWRPLEDIPVLARAGAIIPLCAQDYTSTANPRELEVHIFPGADGHFVLWEDQGDTTEDRDENWVSTEFEMKWSCNGDASFRISPATGNLSVIPEKRSYVLLFRNVENCRVSVRNAQKETAVKSSYDCKTRTLSVVLPDFDVEHAAEILFPDGLKIAENDIAGAVYKLLDRAQTEYDLKAYIQRIVECHGIDGLTSLIAMDLDRALIDAVSEILLA